MAKNRKRYQRRLDVGSIISLFSLAVVVAVVACGFVGIKNAHIERSDLRRTLEEKIVTMEKEVDTIDLRIAVLCDRRVLTASLLRYGSKLVPIMSSEELSGLPAELPEALAFGNNLASENHH